LTSALDGDEWSASHLSRFTPRERAPGTHWIGGWLVPRAILDTVVKRKIRSPCQESNPRTWITYENSIHKKLRADEIQGMLAAILFILLSSHLHSKDFD
jgi:hypothetical protein